MNAVIQLTAVGTGCRDGAALVLSPWPSRAIYLKGGNSIPLSLRYIEPGRNVEIEFGDAQEKIENITRLTFEDKSFAEVYHETEYVSALFGSQRLRV